MPLPRGTFTFFFSIRNGLSALDYCDKRAYLGANQGLFKTNRPHVTRRINLLSDVLSLSLKQWHSLHSTMVIMSYLTRSVWLMLTNHARGKMDLLERSPLSPKSTHLIYSAVRFLRDSFNHYHKWLLQNEDELFGRGFRFDT